MTTNTIVSDQLIKMAQEAYDRGDKGDKELAIILFTASAAIMHGHTAVSELASICISFSDGLKRDVELSETATRLFGADDILDW